MIYSLLNAAVGIESLLLTILIVLGVVVAGALIVYLLWEVVESLSKKTNEDANNDVKVENKTNNNVFIADYQLDAPKQEEPVLDEAKIEEVDEEKATEEQEALQAEAIDEERQNEERRAYLEARRQELIKRMQEAAETESEEEAEDEEEEVEESTEETAEVAETESEEETEAEVEAEEKTEEVDALAEERAALNAEKERYEAMVEELAAAKKALLEQQAQVAPVGVETIVTNENPLSLEELKARLEATEERLKATEKEFKQCKKEYIPLKKVWKAYEKDEKKLRRKEAMVAKQKVLLYGVNNFADIDQEKAQALAEDIELLDKLKLSVQHCEEVMRNNEDRYPLLEKMYEVLKQRNDELKNDIAVLKSEIERIEAGQDNE